MKNRGKNQRKKSHTEVEVRSDTGKPFIKFSGWIGEPESEHKRTVINK